MKIDISGLNKAQILVALYNNAKPIGLGFIDANSKPMSIKEAEDLLKEYLEKQLGYFDYLHGKALKISLRDDILDTTQYNHNWGEGSAEAVIEKVRKGEEVTVSSYTPQRPDEQAAAKFKEDGDEEALHEIIDAFKKLAGEDSHDDGKEDI